jgi:hypothetical protein
LPVDIDVVIVPVPVIVPPDISPAVATDVTAVAIYDGVKYSNAVAPEFTLIN